MVRTRLPRIPSRLKKSYSVSDDDDEGETKSPIMVNGDAAANNTSHSKNKPSMAGSHASMQLALKAKVIKGRNLAAKDKSGYSDPYLVLTLGDARSSTVTIPKTLNPEWNETLEFAISGAGSLLLEVACWDKDRFGKDYMGEFDVPLEDVFAHGSIHSEPTWYRLESRKAGKKKDFVTGEVLLELSIFDPIQTSATPQQIHSKLSGMIGSTPEQENDVDSMMSRTSTNDRDDESDEAGETTDVNLDEPEDPNRTETSEKRSRRMKLARIRKRAKQKAYEFSGTSDLAGVLFLEIAKVTDLPPEKNVTRTTFDMDPFVITSLGKKTYKTKVIRHNLNPVYDEKLVFQVLRHEVNYSLSFTVVDRDKMSGNDYVGVADFPLNGVTELAPTADPKTGLYSLKESVTNFQEGSPPEVKKSKFRLPISRSSSATNIKAKGGLHSSSSQSSLNGSNLDGSFLSTSTSNPTSNGNTSHPESLNVPDLNKHKDSGANDDPELSSFVLPIKLKNAQKWEEKHRPLIFVRAKYLPYKALRQQFWRAMLRQYDADDSGWMSKVELTTMLDTLGSTLHGSTIDGFFKRFQGENNFGEEALTYDQAVRCLEDLLQSFEEQKSGWHFSTARQSPQPQTAGKTRDQSKSDSPNASAYQTPPEERAASSEVPVLPHEHHGPAGEEGETIDANDLADERGEEHIVEIRECPICHQPRLGKRTDSDIITHIATCASQDWRQVNNIVMAGFVTSSQAQRKWYSKVVTKIGYGGYKLGANSANILVQDRITGLINEERMSIYVRLGIRLLYKGLKSRDMEKRRIRKLLRSLSYKQGRKFDDPASRAEIQGFINFHQLDMSEVLEPVESFRNFNEFFYRALKPTARPCSAPDRPHIITSPADCRSVVFNKLADAQSIWVKGREFSVERLFGDAYPDLAKRYAGGALAICRLAPQDYHRFHIPVDGVMGEPKLIEGEYYTVNPMAIRSALDVYGENIRVLVPIDSEKHGKVMVVCVGAMMVGSTVITRKKGEKVRRADELGYFKFGGSTILLLFEPGVMTFDPDLVDNSRAALETLLRVGMSIGHSPGHAPHAADIMPKKGGGGGGGEKGIKKEEEGEAMRRVEGSLAPVRGEDGGSGDGSGRGDGGRGLVGGLKGLGMGAKDVK